MSTIDDFPGEALGAYDLERRSPDDVVCELIDMYGPERICAVLRKQAAEKTRPPMTVTALLDRLSKPSQGLTTAVSRLRSVCA